MKIEHFVLGPVMTNAYLLYNQQHQGVIIDPGMNPASLLTRVKAKNLRIEAILLTHSHFDHIGGLEETRALCKAPVYIHKVEANGLVDPYQNGSAYWPDIPQISCQPADYLLAGGEELQFLGQKLKLQVKHTPGHSPGSISFLLPKIIFSGDLLFKDSIGRTDLPGGDYKTLLKSIRQTIVPLSKETIVYTGHGPKTTVGRELQENPFIKELTS